MLHKILPSILDSCHRSSLAVNICLLSLYYRWLVLVFLSLFIFFLANPTHPPPFQVLNPNPQTPTTPLSIRPTRGTTNELSPQPLGSPCQVMRTSLFLNPLRPRLDTNKHGGCQPECGSTGRTGQSRKWIG